LLRSLRLLLREQSSTRGEGRKGVGRSGVFYLVQTE
jgi:hypothetical protein